MVKCRETVGEGCSTCTFCLLHFIVVKYRGMGIVVALANVLVLVPGTCKKNLMYRGEMS